MVTILLINKIAQLFVILILGYLLVKCKLVRAEDSAVLSKISLYLLMPCVLINAFDVTLTEEIKSGLMLSFGVSIGIHILFLLLDILYKKWGKAGAVERASVAYSNAGNLIIPIVSYILGEEWLIYTCAYLSIQIVFLWTHGIGLFAHDKKFDIKKIVLNINILATVVGFIMMFFNLRLPSFAREVTTSLSSMIGTIGMLICGMLAASVDFKKLIKNKRLYSIIALRMFVYPALVLLFIKLTHAEALAQNGDKILLITFLASMTPAAATVMQMAQLHDCDADFAGGVNIATTLVCILSMPIFVALYQML